ncbi:MAG: DUF6576 domain-containing protein, partial [Verrucomicrobiota bacterium]
RRQVRVDNRKAAQDRRDLKQKRDSKLAEARRKRKEQAMSYKPKSPVSDEVDAILDKISADGFQSLTDEERKLLEDSSDELAKRNRK